MIDWLWLRLPVAPSSHVPSGVVMSITADGDLEWQTHKWFNARGSHDATLAVRIDARGDLHISGSPAKFLQGHNLFGSDDVQALAAEMVNSVLLKVPGIQPDERTHQAIATGAIDVLRVDLTRMYSVGSRSAVHDWIRGSVDTSTMRHRGRAVQNRETVQWGAKSRYFSVKAYCKGHEIEQKGHQLPAAISTPEMLTYADDALRIEVQMNARELRRVGMHLVSAWRLDTPAALYSEYVGRINFAGNIRMTKLAIGSLPRELRRTYELWQAGSDVRSLLSVRTFYRHRRLLLDLAGVDIVSRRPATNVVPLVRIIEAVPKPVPEWAVGTPLYFEPRRIA
jgi:II/X family phage/plasmid replication protein